MKHRQHFEWDFILASASPRRRALLKTIVPRFRIIPSGVNESRIREKDPVRFAREAATAKAKEVGESAPDSLVLAADTIVCLGDEIFGKPADRNEARAMLLKLSGKRHRVITAVAFFRKTGDIRLCDTEESDVTFKTLDRGVIEAYLETDSPLDKAGAYAIQEVRDTFVESLEGSVENVIGLPVRLVRDMLQKLLGLENS